MRKSFSFAVICRVIANLCGVATAFISIRLYNHYVTKEVYGAILVGLQIIGYLPLMSGGFRMVLNQQMLAEPDAAKTQAIARFGQTLQSYFFLVVVLAGMAVMAGYSQLPGTRAMEIPIMVFVTTGIAAAINFQAGSQLALLVALGEQAVSSLIQGAWGIVTLLSLWISFALGAGVWAFPISNGLGALATIFIIRIALAWTRNPVPLFVWERESDFWARFKAIWHAAFDCLYFQVTTVLIFTLDLILVGELIGLGAAAVYGVVTRITAISRQVLQSLSEAAWPRLTQELDPKRRADMMRKVDRLNAWLAGSWYGAMGITLLPFLDWLAPDWVASPTLAALIVTRSFVTSSISPHAYGLLSAARFRDLARVSAQEVLVGLVAALLFTCVFRLGVNGMALAFLLSTLGASGWQMTRRYFQLAHDTHWIKELFAVYSRSVAAGAVSLVVAAGLWQLVRLHVGTMGWLAVPVGGVAFIVPVGAVMLCWRMAGKIP